MSTTDLAWFKSSYSGGDGDSFVEVALEWRKSSYSSGSGDDCVEVAMDWHKSTYSSDSGDSCVEVAMDWHKSSHSSGSAGDCVEVAACPSTVHVRDSKIERSPQLALAPDAWARFVAYAVAG
ncbi:hypothetical protein EES43_24005 [Streptomyces sp. ADI96-02]|uniref:DUF397 domain-containing protein n=1 Tax=Streptomyces sp. ADI96-02 TaxID=1522760 RepID=UPI000F556490|nr:DUF397 domain-containing protein [Streptomyces sp. ADI96-02]RPK56451.1 hypothetical protein EES43_24005 [Streptomyces sp. ADI96-02]